MVGFVMELADVVPERVVAVVPVVVVDLVVDPVAVVLVPVAVPELDVVVLVVVFALASSPSIIPPFLVLK